MSGTDSYTLDEFCDTCERISCQCCSDCSHFPCDCDICEYCEETVCTCVICDHCSIPIQECDGFKTSVEQVGWERRGKFPVISGTNHWRGVWKLNAQDVSPSETMADFYLLEALRSNVLFPWQRVATPVYLSVDVLAKEFNLSDFQKRRFGQLRLEKIVAKTNGPEQALERVRVAAGVQLYALVDRVLPAFRAYTHMAIAGEARWHHALRVHDYPKDRSTMWAEWKAIWEQVGNEGISDLEELFLDFGYDESTSYGGDAWATIARVLYQFEEGQLGPDDSTNRMLFLDRIATLEHNSGNFLTKIRDWKPNISSASSHSMVWEMQQVLFAHSANDPRFDTLVCFCSDDVREMVRTAETAYNDLTMSNSRIGQAAFSYRCLACGKESCICTGDRRVFALKNGPDQSTMDPYHIDSNRLTPKALRRLLHV